MYRRISSWPAVGLIDHLTSMMLSGDLERAIRQHTWKDPFNKQGPGDRTLSKALHEAKAVIPTIMLIIPLQFHSVDTLLSAVSTAVKDDQGYNIYGQETAFEFHCLLVAVFIGFARSLTRLKKLHIKVGTVLNVMEVSLNPSLCCRIVRWRYNVSTFSQCIPEFFLAFWPPSHL